MSTNRVNNSTTPLSPLLTGKPQDAAKAAGAKGVDPTGILPGGAAGAEAGDGQKTYDVKISAGAKGRAEAHQKALGIARATPDMDEAKVASLKEQIANGSYKVDAGKIADGMLREAVRDHLAETER